MSALTQYNTTFHFYYPDNKSARNECAKLKRIFPTNKISIQKVKGDQLFWAVNMVTTLTARSVQAHDIALKIRFPQYDGWDVDTRDPQRTAAEFGYDLQFDADAVKNELPLWAK